MNRRQKIIVSVTGIFIVLLILIGLTYGYFLTRITGNGNPTSISVTTANLELVYGDGTTAILTSETPLMPSSTPIGTKDFTVTNNGDDTEYVVVFEDIIVTYAADTVIDGEAVAAGTETTFELNDFVYTLTCTKKDGSKCDGVENETFPMDGGIVVGNNIVKGDVHTYVLTLYYKDSGLDQSNDMNKTLNGKVNIKDIKSINPYSENTNSLAYNIINNSMLAKNGTELVSTPLSGIATSISGKNYDTTITESTATISSVNSTYGEYYWTYADGYTVDEKNGFTLTGVHTCKYSECFANLKDKYLVSNSAYSNGYAIDSTRPTTGLMTIYKVTTPGTSATSSVSLAKYSLPTIDIEEKTLSTTVDDLGVSYYYRGNVNDNFVNFAGMCWKIVRIEGDGSVKLILEDQYTTCNDTEDTDGTGTIDYAYTGNWSIGTGNYGYTSGKVTNSNGQESSYSNYLADYLNGQTNTSSSMKTKLDAWLTSSGIDTSKLKKDNWCLGNTIDAYNTSTGVKLESTVNDLMYNSKNFYYDIAKRLVGIGETPNATLKCSMNNYETHESYIGTLTADEVVYAGGTTGLNNTGYYYLINDYQYNNEVRFRTLSPSSFDSYEGDCAFCVGSSGSLFYDGFVYNDTFYVLRPAVTLLSNTSITSGSGTQSDPYVVVD